MAKRKPRKSLELCEKLKVIDELKAGKSIDDVHVQFGISKSHPSKNFLHDHVMHLCKIHARNLR